MNKFKGRFESQIDLEEDIYIQSSDEDDIDIDNDEEETIEAHEENPVSNSGAIECLIKFRTHFQSLRGTSETFSAIQEMKKTLLIKN